MAKSIFKLTDEARFALRHKGPGNKRLIRMLNSNDEIDMPSSRHVRWMAAELLKAQGASIKAGILTVPAGVPLG